MERLADLVEFSGLKELAQARISRAKDTPILYLPLKYSSQVDGSGALNDSLSTAVSSILGTSFEVRTWHGPASSEFIDSKIKISQLTRAVLARSNLFWEPGLVRLVVSRGLYNAALGDFVRSQLKALVVEASQENFKIEIQVGKT